MKVFDRLDRYQRQNLCLLFAVGLCFWSSLSVLLPTLPLYIEKILGGTPHQVGLVMGSFAIGLLLFRPWLGQLADRRGRRIVLLIGTAAVAIAPLGYLGLGWTSGRLPLPELLTQSEQTHWLFSPRPIEVMAALRAFHGISIAAFTTAYVALVTDLAPPKNRGELIGYMSLVNPIGLAIGPAIGGFLEMQVGYAALFLLATGLGTVGWLGSLKIDSGNFHHKDRLPSSLEPQSTNLPVSTLQSVTPQPAIQQARMRGSYWQLLFSPPVRVPAIVLLLVGIVFGTLVTFVPLLIEETGIGLNAGLFYTASAIASFSVRIFAGRASDRYGRGRFITLSLCLYALSMVVLQVANSATVFLLAGAIQGMGFGLLIPLMAALIADRCYPHERGRMFSLCMIGFDSGIALAGPLLGIAAQEIGYSAMFSIAALLALLATAVFVTQASKDLRHSLRFALSNAKDAYALEGVSAEPAGR